MASSHATQVVWVVMLLIAVGALFLIQPGLNFLNRKERATQGTMEQWANRLDQDADGEGGYVKNYPATLPANDAWGRPLELAYHNGEFGEVLTIRSLGKDGVAMTGDDITVTRSAATAKTVGGQIGTAAGSAIVEAASEAVGSAADKVKEKGAALRDRLKRKTDENTGESEEPEPASDEPTEDPPPP